MARLSVFGFVLLVLTSSCNRARDPVNRVQPYAIEKAVFAGEWYYLQTVIDSPYSAAYTFVGEQSLLEKVRWEIQEDLLIARRSYEWVAGSEGEGISEGSETGAPIAIYRIESHFDIRRDYNDVTGEEVNVLVENDTDRPWYEREYMRVDWSANLITEPEFLVYARLFDGIEAEPVAYYVEDPSHPNAPRFERASEDGGINYIDVVNKMLVQPGMLDIEGWGQWPLCWLEYSTHVDCASSELTVRHSFLRADPEHDYQPLDWTGDRMEQFGYFVSERSGYDPHYGAVEPARHRFINRHNLWQESYRRLDGERMICYADEECSDVAGSVCDFEISKAERTVEGACTIPYRDRAVRPIAYHVSERFPEDLLDTARHTVDEWNGAFVDVVASLRENECRTLGGGDECAAERTREDARKLFVLCQNPVADGDDPACGAPGTVARIGDVRYSLLAWVPEPHMGSPLGYGPSAADPETGELIQGNAFVYGAGVEELAAYARDLMALLTGDLPPEDVISGADVEAWVEAMANGEIEARHVVPLDGRDAARIGAAVDLSRVHAGRRGEAVPRPESRGAFVERRAAALRDLSRRRAFGGAPALDSGRARLAALRGTPIEEMLTGPEMLAAARIDPRLPLDEGAVDAASPLAGMSLSRMRAIDRMRRTLLRERCVMRAADFADDGLLGLARAIQRAMDEGDGSFEIYGVRHQLRGEDGALDYDAVRRMLRHPIFASTAEHEIGHTLGLRHNFSGSYDALNYHPRYWQLRNDGNMHPRAWDPITSAEIDGRIREAQYSTVMDYGHNFVVTDAEGIGHYDRAAIKMGYGDLVEVFEGETDAAELGWISIMQRWGWPSLVRGTSFLEGYDVQSYAYTELPALAGGIDALEQRADVPYTSLVPEPSLEADGLDIPLVDEQGRPTVPYRFCSDEYSDLSPDCMLYDAGADHYESLNSLIDSYWNYYLFSNFRREQLGFDVWPYFDRVYYRYFSKLQWANQDYALSRAWMEEIFYGDPSLERFFTREDGMGAFTLGAASAFSLFARVIAAPEPGGYVTYDLVGGGEALFLDEYYEPEVELGVLDGRYLQTSWDFDGGYYWYDMLDRIGYFYDKALALQLLVDPETNLLGKDTESDVRGYAISFATTFPGATTELLAGLLSDDWSRFAPRAAPGGGLVYPDPLQIAEGGMEGTPIDPNAGFSVQLYGAVFGMALVPASYDDQFLEQARIYALGGPEGVELPPTERVEFVDPYTGLTYAAGSYPDEAGVETGLGARMLRHAQVLLDGEADHDLDLYMDTIRIQRALSWELGFGP